MKKLEMEDLTKTNLNIAMDEQPQNDLISMLAIQELLNIKKLKTITRIKPEQVSNISKLYMFSQTFNTSFTKTLADMILQLQVSINGLGRKELVQLVQKREEVMTETRRLTSKDIFR